MIHVDRSAVPAPESLRRRAENSFLNLQKFFQSSAAQRAQRVAKFDTGLIYDPQVVKALWQLFEHKCAYCETLLPSTKHMRVDAFRPNAGAAQLDGEVSPEHYWWLAYDWSNLNASCGACNSHKGHRFPVKGSRATPRLKLASETALLLDPCDPNDNPEEHLLFQPDGTVLATSEKGAVTIDVFGLNRVSLVQSRRESCDIFDSIADAFLSEDDPRRWNPESFIKVCLGEHVKPVPYVALARQHLRRYFERATADAHGSGDSTLFRYKRLPTREPYHGAVWLERIEIRNFKALQHLEISFPSLEAERENNDNAGNDERQPWLVLLGENGVGKSSLLKAVALALTPSAQRAKLVPHAGELVTRNSDAPEGLIRLSFNVGAAPLELHFSRKSRIFGVSGEAPDMALLAYGSTRLLPPESEGRSSIRRRLRVGNLFSARTNLANGERWLCNRKTVKQKHFDLMVSGLRQLLSLVDEDELNRQRGRLRATVANQPVAIRELSDGYQSIMALALDMMMNLSMGTFDPRSMEGLVLIDELEVHLHPQWKIQVVDAFRALFPRVRFIVTTHDPLCVQGLKHGELHVLSRDYESREIAARQMDVPAGLRADQILTGSWFNLESTRDPQTLRWMERHGQLLLVLERTAEQERELHELREAIRARIGRFADSPYERAALRAHAELAPRATRLRSDEEHERMQQRIRELLPLEDPH